jgi:heme exporter protein D
MTAAGIEHYLAMGGYAVFVWPAYGVALAVLGGLTLWCWQRYRAGLRALGALQRDAESAAARGHSSGDDA